MYEVAAQHVGKKHVLLDGDLFHGNKVKVVTRYDNTVKKEKLSPKSTSVDGWSGFSYESALALVQEMEG